MASVALSLTDLPSKVLVSVLGRYSSGRTLSSFLCVALGQSSIRQAAFAICRGALMQRYLDLSQDSRIIHAECNREIGDTFDYIRDDIRLSNADDDDIVSKFSEWCAVVDYFEMQLEANSSLGFRYPQWIVWCGEMEVPFGRLHGYLTTPFWTVCAMQYWRNQEFTSEDQFFTQFSVTRSKNFDFTFKAKDDDRVPYGAIFGVNERDRTLLNIQCSDLEVHSLDDENEIRLNCLVHRNESLEDWSSYAVMDYSLICQTHANVPFVRPLLIDPGQQSLCCCWDIDLGEHLWDDAISNFGENAIRIMESLRLSSTDDFRDIHGHATVVPVPSTGTNSKRMRTISGWYII